jgi:membrane protease YdiL (CAAX protease family)
LNDPAPAQPGSGPPGGGIFTLEGRTAPGLYLVSWVASVVGLVLVFLLGPLASSEIGRVLLVGAGAVLLTIGLAVGCGYQVVQRRDRHPERYRGPAPLLVFATYFFALGLLGLAAVSGGLVDPAQPLGFVSIGALQALGYAIIVWLFVVRTGALSWSAMGWPTWQGGRAREVLGAIGVAVAVMLPTTFVMLILGGLLGLLLGVEAPDVLPTPGSSLEALAIATVAALIIPAGEELFFRGFALTAWLRDLGPRSALIRSSVFFAVIHIANITTDSFTEGAAQALLQTTVILPLGFVLGWLFLRRGMSGAIAGHVTYNATLLFLSLLVLSLPDPG